MKQLLTTICGIALFASMLGDWAAASDSGVQVIRNQVYVERPAAAGGDLELDLYLPPGEGPFPAVLLVHGGAWTIGTRGQLATVAMAFAERGYAAAAISYRLAPRHRFPAQLFDCQAAVRWLRENAKRWKIDPARIGGYGYSAGGQLVALLGALDDQTFREPGIGPDAPSARLQVVVAGGAPCDFRAMPANSLRLAYWLGGTRAARPEAYRTASPAAFVTADAPPMLFFHGTDDLLVPIGSPQRMVELLAGCGVRAVLHRVVEKGHIDTLFDREALRVSLAFVDDHLKGGGAAVLASDEQPAGASDGQ